MATTINLDFVGLNTLVNEPITSSTNTIGHALSTTASAYVNTVTIGDNHSVSIPHDDYLVALNIHRNGPYGTPIFKQLRAANNPLIRYQNRNNIFSYVTDQGRIRQSLRNNAVVNSFRERRSKLRQIVETPVYENKPITVVGSVTEIDPRTGKEIKQRVEIKSSFNNETQYFGNRKTNRELEADFELDEGYEQLTDLYLDGGLDADDSPIDEVELVKYETTIYPRQDMLGRTNRRPNFLYKSWHSDRSQRQQGPHVDTGFGYFVPSQSSWPLDIGPDESGITLAFFYDETLAPENQGKNDYQWLARDEDYFPGALMGSWRTILGDPVGPKYSDFLGGGAASGSFNRHGIQSYIGKFSPFTQQANNTDLSGNFEQLRFGSQTYEKMGGSQKWEAPKFSGRTPFYDSYADYCELISKVGKDHTVVPEFRISELVEELSNKGELAAELLSKPLLSITGGIESADSSQERPFFKVYSTSDFLKNFDIVQEDHEGFLDAFKLTLKCKAIKKFLPYEGFYPVERTVDLSKKFYQHYSKNTITKGIPGNLSINNFSKFQSIMTPLFAPGILYNTIKSGIACDYPVSLRLQSQGAYYFMSASRAGHTPPGSFYPISISDGQLNAFHLENSKELIHVPYFATHSSGLNGLSYQEYRLYGDPRRNKHGSGGRTIFDYEDRTLTVHLDDRIPFEAILTPGEFLRQKEINAIRPDVGKFQYSITMTQRDNPDYIKFASNFLSEIGEFFLENKNFTALASLPQEDPNFGNAKAGRKYMMRLKMYRSVTGSKPERTSSRGPFEYPQDDSNFGETGSFFRETFTMYSNPQAFGDMALVDCPLGTNFRNTTTNPHFYNNFKDTFTYFISASHEKSGLGFNNRYEIKQWKSFQKEEHRFSYNPGVHAFNSGSGADNYLFFSGSYMSVGNDIRQGENFPYTPPYYHGEAWADFTFQADASKKYTLAEILNDTSIEFYRYYNEDLPMNADSLGSMKIARALDASKITGSSPAPRIEFFFPRQYAAIGTSIGPFASSSNIATTYKQTIIFASASLFAGTPNNNEIYINVQTSGDLPQLHATLLAKAINGTTDGDIKYGTMSGSVSGIHYFTANVDEVSGSETQVKYVSLTGSSALGGYGDHCFETYPTIGSNKDYVVYNQVGRSAFDAYTLSNHTQDSGQLFRKNFIKNYRMVNEKAMQLASSVNLLSRGVISDIEASSVNGIVNQANVNVDTEVQNSSRWIIQSKLETPMLNFNHISFDDVHTQTLHSSSATTIGMWHQYGRLPQEASEGVFIQLEAIPDTWIENVMGGDAQLTGSLLDLCGFSREPSRLGQVAESKVVSEAVVAVPFIPRGGQRKFFNLDRKDVEHAQDPGTQNLVGRTIIDQVRFMEKYVFPPSMDFIRNPSIDPFAMYIFPFEHEFSKQDLANIWQNLSPDIGLSHEVSEATISHELLFHELLGRGAIIKPGNNTEKELVKNARFKKINSRIKWLVFKVKQRASTDYFSKIFANNESGTRRERRAQRKKRRRLSNLLSRSPAQYNWPYDFFSLVELVKIDAEVDFANPDDDLTQDNRTVIRPREKVPRPSGPTKEERLARAMLGEPQRDDPTIVTENPKKPNPKGGKSKRKKTLRRKK